MTEFSANLADRKRYKSWRKDFVQQHTPKEIGNWIQNLFSYSSIRWGDIKSKQGDIVIVNLEKTNDFIDLQDLLSHCFAIDHIETIGRYTNIYFKNSFFIENLKCIVV